MCRMFGALVHSEDELLELLGCLSDAARSDFLYSRESPAVHRDGWGLMAYHVDGITVYRSSRPIFEEVDDDGHHISVRPIEYPALVIAHARWASDPSTVGAASAHPYLARAPFGLIALAHNGSVSREQLSRLLGVQNYADYVDSELALEALARLSRGEADMARVIDEALRPATLSALDLLIMVVRRGSARLMYYQYNVRGGEPNEYYALRLMGRGFSRAVASSTVAEYCRLRPSGWLDLGRAPYGRLEELARLP